MDILVEPLDFENNRVSVVCKAELEPELGHLATARYAHAMSLVPKETVDYCV